MNAVICTIHTIDGAPIEIGKRYWYEGHKNVSRDNIAGPVIRDHPALEVTLVEKKPDGRLNKGNLVIRFDKPMADYGKNTVQEVQVGVFEAADGKLYAGHFGYHDFDGFLDPCNFFGLYSSKEKRNTPWPSLRRR